MKKAIFIVVISAIAALGATILFYRQSIKGLLPAFSPPPTDIAKLIEEEKAANLPLKLPPGFSIGIFAKNLVNPRVMTFDPAGNLIVSITSQGKVVALPDKNSDGTADRIITLLDNLNLPHGLAVKCKKQCRLYVAETDKVTVYDLNYDVEAKIYKPINGKKIIDLPAGSGHFTRSILFLPAPFDNKLLISVGSSCNVCNEKDWRRAKILVVNEDGSNLKEYATGLRNSVFMTIHPVTGEIWATEMGRDWLGDDLPPDEVNIIKENGNYGWPICYGKNIHDSDFDKNTYIRNPCSEPYEIPSHIDIPAHSAPLGLAFFPEEGWPKEYWNNLLVAYHGSWNRTQPTGYKVVMFKLDSKGTYLGEEDFITGWLQKNGALGRPVDILIQPGGLIYISDDKAGVIYRVAYKKPQENLIIVDYPQPNDVIKSPLTVVGKAPGQWFFEASFPVRLYDSNGEEIAKGIAQAKEDWMTTDLVPFEVKISFAAPLTERGELVFEKDNPSGLPEHAAEFRVPVKFR